MNETENLRASISDGGINGRVMQRQAEICKSTIWIEFFRLIYCEKKVEKNDNLLRFNFYTSLFRLKKKRKKETTAIREIIHYLLLSNTLIFNNEKSKCTYVFRSFFSYFIAAFRVRASNNICMLLRYDHGGVSLCLALRDCYIPRWIVSLIQLFVWCLR